MPIRCVPVAVLVSRERLVVLVGSKRAISKAVRTKGVGRRYAALANLLQRRIAAGTASVSQVP